MTKTVKKRLQAVVALLVTLMIMVGIMPSEPFNTTVYADTNVYNASDTGTWWVFFHCGGWGTNWNDNNGHSHTWSKTTGIQVSTDDTNWYDMSESPADGDWNCTFFVYGFSSQPAQIRFRQKNQTYNNDRTAWVSNPAKNGVYEVQNGWNSTDQGWNITWKKTFSNGSTQQQEQQETPVVEKKDGTYRAVTTLFDYKYDTEMESSYTYDHDKDGNGNVVKDTGHRGGGRWMNMESIPYEQLNKEISDYYKNTINISGDKALYFGNFNETVKVPRTDKQWATGLFNDGYAWKRYDEIYDSWDDDANGKNNSASTTGLVAKTLTNTTDPKSGNLHVQGSSAVLPYFDKTFGSNHKYNGQPVMTYNELNNTNGFVLKRTIVNGISTYSYHSATDGNNYFDGSKFNIGSSGPKNYSPDNAILNSSDLQGTVYYGKCPNDLNGLFPFNNSNIPAEGDRTEVNYGFGIRLDMPFNLTTDGKVEDSNRNRQPIKFKFSGDDDVWVFIDGVLMLDLGGDHSVEVGEIDFSDKKAIAAHFSDAGLASSYNADEFYNPRTEHMLSFFYMERGMFESNMSVEFTLIPADDPDENPPSELKVEKTVDQGDISNFYTDWTNNATGYTIQNQSGISAAYNLADQTAFVNNLSKNLGYAKFPVVIENTDASVGAGYLNGKDENSQAIATNGSGMTHVKHSSVQTFSDSYLTPAQINSVNVKNKTALKVGETVSVVEQVAEPIVMYGAARAVVGTLFKTDLERYKGSTGVPPSGSSEVTRENVSGLSFTITGTGTDSANPDRIKFINTMRTGSLKITKNIKTQSGGNVTDATESAIKKFTVQIVLDDFGGMGLEDVYNENESNPLNARTNDVRIVIEREISIAAGQSTASITIPGIPANTRYTVTETTDTTYSDKNLSNDDNVIYSGVETEVVITNTKTVTVQNNVDIGIIKRWYPLNSSTTLPTEIKFLLQKSTNGTTWEDVTTAGTNGVVTLTNANAKKYDASGNVVNGDGAYEYMEWKLAARITVPKDTNVQYRILEYSEGQKSLILENEGLYATDCKAYYKDGNNDTNVKALSAATYANNTELVAWLVTNKDLAANANENAIQDKVNALTSADKDALAAAHITANPVVDLAVKNEYIPMGTAMPKTGARGVYAIVTFGAFAITIAGVALLIYRKKLQTVNIYAVKGSEKPKE